MSEDIDHTDWDYNSRTI